MAYSAAWDETAPVGSTTQAADIDLVVRNLKRDLRERLNELFTDFTTDPALRKDSALRARAWRSTTQSLTTGAVTAIGFDNETFDTGTLHNNVTNNSRITIPTGQGRGAWLLHGHAVFAANATGVRELRIKKNGATDLAIHYVQNVNGTDDAYVDVACLVSAPAVTDYFEIFARQTSGGNLNVQPGETLTFFEAVQIL